MMLAGLQIVPAILFLSLGRYRAGAGSPEQPGDSRFGLTRPQA
jgi:hypothetical protein